MVKGRWCIKKSLSIVLSLFLTLTIIVGALTPRVLAAPEVKKLSLTYTIDNVPEFSGSPYVEINGNVPSFDNSEITTDAFEHYSELDELNRCGVAYANICKEIMPTAPRGAIGMVKPSGWHTVKYDFVDGKYLYNRCHLIGYQLAGENANERNLITGTRYLNVQGMLPFEDQVAYYVERTGNHVLYRVTPVFMGRNLVASGVQIEAYSVEDNGKGVSFNVYCYNAQPGVTIDYASGESRLSSEKEENAEPAAYRVSPMDIDPNGTVQNTENKQYTYVLNKNSKKFHTPNCDGVKDMKEKNKEYFYGSREEAVQKGYTPCKSCNP